MKTAIIRKTALAVIKEGKILLARSTKNTEVFYTLGGKIKPGESEFTSLEREVMEEAGTRIEQDSLRFLKEFEAPAHGKPGMIVNIRLYQGRERHGDGGQR